MSTTSHDPQGTPQALREVPPDKAFYFYFDVGSPTDKNARSYLEFMQLVRTIDVRSIQFHLKRADFQNWFRMLGDGTTAQQLGSIIQQGMTPEDIRRKVLETLTLRYNSLQAAGQQQQQKPNQPEQLQSKASQRGSGSSTGGGSGTSNTPRGNAGRRGDKNASKKRTTQRGGNK